MIAIKNLGNKNVIATVASGKLDEKDYEKLKQLLSEKIESEQNINWYFEMQDFDGWTAKALWEDVKIDIKLYDNYKKIAMVGDEKWEKWMSKLMKPFTSAEVKYFKLKDKKIAQEWIQ